MADNSKFDAAINETKQLIASIGGNTDPIKVPGACKIGTVWLPIPPSQMTISEVNDNQAMPTIRTPGNPKIKTGKQEVRIDMEVFFPSLHDINTKFRPLLAQFIRSPFLPVENAHLRSILMPRVQWSQSERKEHTNPQLPIPSDQYFREYEASKDDSNILLVGKTEEFRREMINEMSKRSAGITKDREDIDDELNRLYIRIREISEDSPEYEDISMRMMELRSKLAKVESKVSEGYLNDSLIYADMLKNDSKWLKSTSQYEDDQLVVAIRNINVSTVPGFPGSLQCIFSFSVFNYKPYSMDFSFIKTIDGALKQVEYFIAKSNLRHPKEARDAMDAIVLERPTEIERERTLNLSECEPFLAYITPVLTGDTVEYNTTFNMRIDSDNSGERINMPTIPVKTGLTFTAPTNWLREVSDVKEFSGFDLEYQMSSKTFEEAAFIQELLSSQKFRLITKDIEQLFGSIQSSAKYRVEILKGQISDVVSMFLKVMTWQIAAARYNEAIEAAGNPDPIRFTLPCRIYKLDGSKSTLIYDPKVRYVAKDIYRILKELKGGGTSGEIILEKLRKKIDNISIEKFGSIVKYKFKFENSDDTIISGISASLANKLATIPLTAYNMPTFQYMGRDDWHLQVNIQTCNPMMLEILRSLSIKASESSIMRNRTAVSSWIAKNTSIFFNPDSNLNGFLKLIGCNYLLFEDFLYETMKGKPGWWNITMRLVQADLDLSLYENLIRMGSYKPELIDDLKSVLMHTYTWEGITERDTLDNYGAFSSKYSWIAQNILPQLRNFVFGCTHNIFYGARPSHPPLPGMVGSTQNDAGKYILGENDVYNYIHKELDSADCKIQFEQFMSFIFKRLPILNETVEQRDKRLPGTNIDMVRDNFDRRIPGTNVSIANETFDRRLSGVVLPIHPFKEFNMGNLTFAKNEIFLRGLCMRALQAAPVQVLNLLNDNKKFLRTASRKTKGYTRKELNPVEDLGSLTSYINDKKKVGDNSPVDMDMFSGYPDLNLPMHRGGVLSTPADFFYKKFDDDIFPFKFLEDRIKAKEDDFLNLCWKQNGLRGQVMLDKMGAKKYVDGIFTRSTADIDRDKRKMELLERAFTDTTKSPLSIISMDYVLAHAGDYKKNVDGQLTVRNNPILLDIAIEHQKLSKVVQESVTVRRKISSYDGLLKLAQDVQSCWSEEIWKKLTPGDVQGMVRNQSAENVSLALRVEELITLADVESRLIEQRSDMAAKGYIGTDINEDNLSKIRSELISQIQVSLDSPLPAELGIITPWSIKTTQDLLSRAREQYDSFVCKNKARRMERAYPTIKLFFIEEDSRSWGLFDDYYMYNSIESFEFMSSKLSATKTATIVISNITGRLDDPYSGSRSEAPLKEGTSEEQTVVTMWLREGVTIMVKAGYDNNISNLETIFYGKVVSSDVGEKVTIVAQSFGAELHELIYDGQTRKCGFNSPCRSHGDVVVWAGGTLGGLDHFGSPNALERLGLMDRHNNTPSYSAQKWRAWDYLRRIHPIFDFYYQFGVYDPRYENIYLAYSRVCMSPWSKLLVDSLDPTTKEGLITTVVGAIIIGVIILSIVWFTGGFGAGALIPLGTAGMVEGSAATIGAGAAAFATGGVETGALAASYITGEALSFGSWFVSTSVWFKAGVAFSSYAFALCSRLVVDGLLNRLFNRANFDWVIPENYSLYQLLSEISLYHEDYILTTLPYNDGIIGQQRETIYLGPRNGLYKYTDIFDSSENSKKMTLNLNSKKALMSAAMDYTRRYDTMKDIDAREKELHKLEAKRDKLLSSEKPSTLEESDQTRLNELLEKYKEDILLKNLINNFKLSKGAEKANILESPYSIEDKDNFVSRVNSVIDNYKYGNSEAIRAEFDKLIQESTIKTADEWSAYIDSDATLSKEIREKIKSLSDGDRVKNGWSRLDDIREVIIARYPGLTTEAEKMKLDFYENSNIVLAIDNPGDLIDDEGRKIYPGYTSVVNYYIVDSFIDIIDNSISASSEEISNRVVLSYPIDPAMKKKDSVITREFLADDNIKGGNIRTFASYQNNIDPLSFPMMSTEWIEAYTIRNSFMNKKRYGYVPAGFNVGYNILANHMRPMYRGTLTIVGTPSIKPYDIVIINDVANQMWGPIEVEAVKHRFGMDGFTTEITPNAVVSYMNPGKALEIKLMRGLKHPLFPFLGNMLDLNIYGKFETLGKTVLTGGLAGGLILGYMVGGPAGLVTMGVLESVLAANFTFSSYSWALGKVMGRDVIDLCGLWYRSQPYVAGMEGAFKDDIKVHILGEWMSYLKFNAQYPGTGEPGIQSGIQQ